MSEVIIYKKNIVFFCLKIFLTFTNCVDPDEMQHYAAFHLALHCLPKYPLIGFPVYKGLIEHRTVYLKLHTL